MSFKNVQSLTEEQVSHFLKKGHLILKGCFTKEAAQPWIDRAYQRLGCDPNDPSTWKEERVALPGENSVMIKEFAPKAWAAICDLVGGPGRVEQSKLSLSDSFIVVFPCGNDKPWEPPSRTNKERWHLDGTGPRTRLAGTDGLGLFVFWSDIRERGGGTFIACDSVGAAARQVAALPEGRVRNIPGYDILDGCGDFLGLTGEAGDIILIHPFMLHSESRNHAGAPRFFTARMIELREPMDLNRPDPADYSVVERAILKGLGVERVGRRQRELSKSARKG